MIQGSTPQTISRGERTYQALRTRLLRGDFAGDRRIREEALAKELGISRTPIREALRRLSVEGLVEHKPNVGAVVRRPTTQEQHQLSEVRELIETYAVRQVAARPSPALIARLQGYLHELLRLARAVRDARLERFDGELRRRWLHANKAIHEDILRAVENPYLTGVGQELGVLDQLFALYEPSIGGNLVRRLARVCLLHGRLIRALRAGDAQRACEVVTQIVWAGRPTTSADLA